MSLSRNVEIREGAIQGAHSKVSEYRFIFALACIVLALGVGSTIFTPVTIGSGISSEISIVGP